MFANNNLKLLTPSGQKCEVNYAVSVYRYAKARLFVLDERNLKTGALAMLTQFIYS